MHKYLLVFVILSIQITAMSRLGTPQKHLDLYEIENAETTKIDPETLIQNPVCANSQQPTIVKSYYYPGTNCSEVEALLSNDDIITYTVFHHWKSSTCIYARTINAHYELRYPASKYWIEQMEKLYKEKTAPKSSNIPTRLKNSLLHLI